MGKVEADAEEERCIALFPNARMVHSAIRTSDISS